MSKARAEDFKHTPGMRTEERMSRLREDAGRARREALQQLRTGPRELDQPLPTGSHDLAQELRRETAAGILRREAAAAMQLDGGEECPHELVLVNRGTNMTIETIKAMLRAVKFVIQTFKITAPEAKEWILQSVYRILIKAKDVVFDSESDSLLEQIQELLGKDTKAMSLESGCIVIKDHSIKMINNLRDKIKKTFDQYIERERRAEAYVNDLTSEDAHERSRKEDAVRDAVKVAQVEALMEGFESETEDAMKSRNNPMFAIGRNEGPPMTRAERLAAARERNMRRIQMAAQQRRAAAVALVAAAEADDDEDADSSEDMVTEGGKRRTRKHKKQMKHKKTKRHRKKTKKHLKKRNNKKQRKTRNRK